MKKEIKNRYVQLWVADCISQSYLKELMEGAKKQQELLVETPSEDLFSFAYILTNGDRLVIIHFINKKSECLRKEYCYQKKITEE